jgi:hypothetical protein
VIVLLWRRACLACFLFGIVLVLFFSKLGQKFQAFGVTRCSHVAHTKPGVAAEASQMCGNCIGVQGTFFALGETQSLFADGFPADFATHHGDIPICTGK